MMPATIIVRKPFLPTDTQTPKPDNNEVEVNPEFEEKPVVESTSFSSEKTHGGNELTFSLPQPQSQSDEHVEESEPNQQSQQSTESREQKIVEVNEEREVEGSSEESLTEQDVESGVGEDEDNEGDGEEQENTYQYNTQQVVDVTKRDVDSSTKYYQTMFYRFIEMIAEEKTRVYDYKNADEYNIKKLMLRQYERKPLNSYRMSRVKDTVVLILDDSGSMEWWSENLQILADLALKREDVDVYLAPNGYIENKLTRSGLASASHEAVMKILRGRKIVYVGDFDGANTPIELSWSNDVIWICPESRYRHFRSHDWVSYDEEHYRGVFVRAFSLEEMFDAFKKILSYQYITRIWIDYHEGKRFGDD